MKKRQEKLKQKKLAPQRKLPCINPREKVKIQYTNVHSRALVGPKMEAKPCVFIIDDDEEMRTALRRLLQKEGIETFTYASGREFLSEYNPLRSGCVLLDIKMPGMDGFAVIREMKRLGPTPPIIVLTGHADLNLAIQALDLGAFAFLEKPIASEELIRRVREALEAEARLLKHRKLKQKVTQKYKQLTSREKKVLARIISGVTNKAISSELRISPRTVEVHRRRLMRKMDASSLSELVAMVVGAELLECVEKRE